MSRVFVCIVNSVETWTNCLGARPTEKLSGSCCCPILQDTWQWSYPLLPLTRSVNRRRESCGGWRRVPNVSPFRATPAPTARTSPAPLSRPASAANGGPAAAVGRMEATARFLRGQGVDVAAAVTARPSLLRSRALSGAQLTAGTAGRGPPGSVLAHTRWRVQTRTCWCVGGVPRRCNTSTAWAGQPLCVYTFVAVSQPGGITGRHIQMQGPSQWRAMTALPGGRCGTRGTMTGVQHSRCPRYQGSSDDGGCAATINQFLPP